ncbi:TetR/AcrR family transcriptional regulator [Streptomyces inhibens]|uniref:TetR/AcrR family transcriptional regulator n=1 Tax=Streptomyces inhibens TaxID=2293571 RepID=A0A371PSJ6_STRIH|nr:TetR-like C-terminal domain-containing protein [Streptomyces inhibens]REK85467.1 TetR/AcrR family transcriptional regulator [Streptomyces inhibens]
MNESAAVRPRNPRGQGERLREELLRATERLLEEVGSEDALSLRAVARAAGVAAPSIYRHFSDKTELVWATLEVSYERLAAAMAEAAAKADDDPVARLRAQLRAYCRYAVAHPATYRLLYETRQTPVGPERLAGHPAGLLVRSWQQALTACEDAGWQVRGSRSEAPYVLWSSVHGRVMLWQVMPSPKDATRLDRFVDEMLRLLLER